MSSRRGTASVDATFDPSGDGSIADARPDAPVAPLDAAAYLPRDAGESPIEPCRGATRRIRFEGFPLEQIAALAGDGDRLATRELDAPAHVVRARVFDVVTGVEVGLSPPIDVRDVGGGLSTNEIVAHPLGFDVVAWGGERTVIARLDRDGVLLGTQTYRRPSPALRLVAGALVRTGRGMIVLTQVADESGEGPGVLALELLGDEGSRRSIAFGLDIAREARGSIAALGEDRIVGALAIVGAGRDPARLVWFDADLTTEVVRVGEAGDGVDLALTSETDGTACYVQDGTAVAAYALNADIGEASALRLVWWTPGGEEIARSNLDRVSIEGVGVLGIAGSLPEQTIALLTGQRFSRGSLLAGQIRSPGALEGATSPLAVGVGLRYGVTWEWRDGGIAIAYSGNGRIEVLLACEGDL